MGEMGESGERATCRRDGFGLARGGGGGLSLSEPLRKTISGSARFCLAWLRVAPARRSDSAAARRSDSAAASSSRCSCCANARSASSCSRFRLASDASETRPGQRDAASRTQDGKSISSTSSSSVVEPSLMWSDTPLEESAVLAGSAVGWHQRTLLTFYATSRSLVALLTCTAELVAIYPPLLQPGLARLRAARLGRCAQARQGRRVRGAAPSRVGPA